MNEVAFLNRQAFNLELPDEYVQDIAKQSVTILELETIQKGLDRTGIMFNAALQYLSGALDPQKLANLGTVLYADIWEAIVNNRYMFKDTMSFSTSRVDDICCWVVESFPIEAEPTTLLQYLNKHAQKTSLGQYKGDTIGNVPVEVLDYYVKQRGLSGFIKSFLPEGCLLQLYDECMKGQLDWSALLAATKVIKGEYSVPMELQQKTVNVTDDMEESWRDFLEQDSFETQMNPPIYGDD